jgi:acyl carrier protein phosphodiesterase
MNWLAHLFLSQALGRIGSSLRRPCDLAAAVAVLEQGYEEFHADFTAFFPELRSAVASKPVG